MPRTEKESRENAEFIFQAMGLLFSSANMSFGLGRVDGKVIVYLRDKDTGTVFGSDGTIKRKEE